jgi:hypothetical protein
MFPIKLTKIVNVPPIDEITLNKIKTKIHKTSRKKPKTNQKKKKIPSGG